MDGGGVRRAEWGGVGEGEGRETVVCGKMKKKLNKRTAIGKLYPFFFFFFQILVPISRLLDVFSILEHAHVLWKWSTDNLLELVLSFYHVMEKRIELLLLDVAACVFTC